MSLQQSLSDTVRDKGRSSVSIVPAKPASVAATSGAPAFSTMVPKLSSGGAGLGMAKKSGMAMGKGMGSKNGVGFPKKASMNTGASGIKGPTGLGKGSMSKGMK